MTVTTASTRDVSEWDFEGPVTPIPGDRVPLTVRFRHDSGWERDVLGFWDGDRRYAVRFSPPLPGRWEWTTRSEAAELHRRHGRFEAVPGKGRGPVRVASRFHFAHADGTPYRPVGATVYNWIHQDDALRRQTVDAVVEAGFNKLRFMVFPQAGGYIERSRRPRVGGTSASPSPPSSGVSTISSHASVNAASRRTCSSSTPTTGVISVSTS